MEDCKKSLNLNNEENNQANVIKVQDSLDGPKALTQGSSTKNSYISSKIFNAYKAVKTDEVNKI